MRLSTRDKVARRCVRAAACATALVVAIAAASATAPAADVNKNGGKPKPSPAEVLNALRALNAASDAATAGGTSSANLPKRPEKKVVPMTITSSELDAMIESELSKAKTPPAPPANDEEFCRRVYLDVTGKLPHPDQIRDFVRTRLPDKRGKLIEHLLATRDYAENWGRYWRDVIKFHATNQNAGQINSAAIDQWLASQFEKNRPWDEIVRELLTATGHTDENGATGFMVAHDAQAVEVAGEVSRIFLGIQIQCAQCHDHPSDSWKRVQFHEFASFFAGGRVRRVGKQVAGVRQTFELVANGKPRYAMPDLKDPTKQIPVAPRFFLGEKPPVLPSDLTAAERRAVAATYVTGQDNPWFARAYVNRVWSALMGQGFYSPVDDMGPGRDAQSKEILETLAKQWQDGGYDVRGLFRLILNTKAYQRQSKATNTNAGRTAFASNCPSRLRADQIYDALAQALDLPSISPANGGKPGKGSPGAAQTQEKAAGKARGKGALADAAASIGANAAGAKKLNAAQINRLGGIRGLFNILYGVDPSLATDDVLGTIPQALFMMNAAQINRGIQATPNTVLGKMLMATPDNRAVLDALYLRVLARRPNAKEVQTCGRYLERVGDRREAFEDILWSLVNSTEFVSRR